MDVGAPRAHAQREPELSFSQARQKAAAELLEREPPVFPHYSLLEGSRSLHALAAAPAVPFRPLHRDVVRLPVAGRAVPRDRRARLVRALSGEHRDELLEALLRREGGAEPADVHASGHRSAAGGHPGGLRPLGERRARLRRRHGLRAQLHRELRPAARADRERDQDGNLVAAAVLSGNRNFEGRINPQTRANYLASPPLVVAYALAGTVDIDFEREPLGTGTRRQAGLPARPLADARGDPRDDRALAQAGAVRRRSTPTSSTAIRTGTRSRWRGRRPLRLGRSLDLHPRAAVLRGPDVRAGAGARHHGRARAWCGSATR